MERIHCSHCQDFGDVWCIGIDEILDMESYKDGNISVSRQVDQKGHMLQLAALRSIYSIDDALGLPPVHQHANNSNLRSHRRWIESDRIGLQESPKPILFFYEAHGFQSIGCPPVMAGNSPN